MYESRLRAAWLQNQKGNNATTNRFAATSSIYRNRAHTFVLQHNKDDGGILAKRKHQEQLEVLQTKRVKLETQLKRGQCDNTYDFIDDMLSQRETHHALEKIKKEYERLVQQNPEELWNQRVQLLKPEYVASLAVLNYASGNHSELFSIDSERCDCGRLYEFNCITYMNICIACNICIPVLVAAEDIQTDVLQQGKATATISPTISPTTTTILGGATVTTEAPIIPQKPSGKLGNFNTYRKYVMQFAPDACNIPKHVWKLLSESFASIHLLSSLRCKPVPVTKILKDNNLQMYMSQSVRITKLFNGDPIPILEMDLITRLLQRWKEIHDVAVLAPDIKGLPGVEMLTHVFLLAEDRADLASAFTTHKTNNVSATQTHKFSQLIEKCARTSTLKWKINAWYL